MRADRGRGQRIVESCVLHWRMQLCLLFAGVALFGGPTRGAYAAGADSLRLPYNDYGACPFECCTYRKWTANAHIRVYEHRSRKSAVIFTLEKGEDVLGVTGVVVTMKPGYAHVRRTLEMGGRKVRIEAGSRIPILRYDGEGYWKYWWDGRFDQEQIPDIDEGARDSTLDVVLESHPDVVWWVKVRNKSGQLGWTDQSDHFDHMDACE